MAGEYSPNSNSEAGARKNLAYYRTACKAALNAAGLSLVGLSVSLPAALNYAYGGNISEVQLPANISALLFLVFGFSLVIRSSVISQAVTKGYTIEDVLKEPTPSGEK